MTAAVAVAICGLAIIWCAWLGVVWLLLPTLRRSITQCPVVRDVDGARCLLINGHYMHGTDHRYRGDTQ